LQPTGHEHAGRAGTDLDMAEDSMKRLVVALVVALLALPLAFVAAPASPASAALPPISAIGDSTLLGMTASARSIVNSSYDMLFEAKSCRRLIIKSCGRTIQHPNTLETMRALQGRLGDAVVIMAGYDDWYDFDVAVDAIVGEAKRQGVGRVIWLTYRSQGPYVGVGGAYFATYRQFNAILAAKARQHPELIVADWDTHSLGKSSWFSSDGIHISSSGATALAHFIKAQLDAEGLHRCYMGTSGTPSAAPTPTAVTQTSPGKFTATNQRLLDTRADGGDAVNAPVGAGQMVKLPLVAQGKVPAGTTAVMVNLTAVGACVGRLRHRLPVRRAGAAGLEPQREHGPYPGRAGDRDAQRSGRAVRLRPSADRLGRRPVRVVPAGWRPGREPHRPGPLPRHP
jgi:hypothetical protein